MRFPFFRLIVKAVATAIVAWFVDRGFDYMARRWASA